LVSSHAEFSSRLGARGCAEKYLSYPNVDNALGPTRPFFSDYLAVDLASATVRSRSILIENSGDRSSRHFRDRLVEPSLTLIRSYDEGNVQPAGGNNSSDDRGECSVGAARDADAAVWGESGLAMHLSVALLPDGSWYEGENYHLFAHRACGTV